MSQQPATQPKQADKSLGELFGEMTSDVSRLFRQEVELAKVETKQELSRAGRAGGMFGAAGLGAWLALLFFSLALAWLLDQALNTALSFAIVGLLWAVVALVLVQVGKKQMKSVQPLPVTAHTLKEDVQWAQNQRS